MFSFIKDGEFTMNDYRNIGLKYYDCDVVNWLNRLSGAKLARQKKGRAVSRCVKVLRRFHFL